VVDRERREILVDLVTLSAPVAELRQELSGWPWDSEPLVTLTVGHAIGALERCLRGDISLGELQAWADAIEMRDDIDLGPSCRDDLRQLESELSTPELFRPVTTDVVRSWLDRLRNGEGAK
jgi:hypothetical protein